MSNKNDFRTYDEGVKAGIVFVVYSIVLIMLGYFTGWLAWGSN